MPRHYDPNQPRVPAGHSDGGQWTDGGDGDGARLQPAFAGPPIVFGVQKAIEAGLLVFAWLTARNSRERQAVIAFKANEYPVRKKILRLELSRSLSRDEVKSFCPRLEDVQKLTNEAAREARSEGAYATAAEYGTAVHSRVKIKVRGEGDPNFRAEISYLKTREETVSDGKTEETYGTKDSIRVDVIENTDKGMVCVYDIKTGRSGLSAARMTEIAGTVFKYYPKTKRIVVTEIRPR
jgi:hypothetical protein